MLWGSECSVHVSISLVVPFGAFLDSSTINLRDFSCCVHKSAGGLHNDGLIKNPCGNPNPQKNPAIRRIKYPHARVQIPFRGGYGVDPWYPREYPCQCLRRRE